MRIDAKLLAVSLACVVWSWSSGTAAAAPKPPAAVTVKVFKTATCGCCQKWVDHLAANGFAPEVEVLPALDAVKDEANVPPPLRSCHTALVGGYVVEGHVPADVVQRMLREKPAIAGIAVPGMPIGSPGMEQGSRKDPYEIVAFSRDGKTSIYDRR
jgi:hypothetical protein